MPNTVPPPASVIRSPNFGVVVLNWNGHRDTVECLESLLRAHPPPDKVIVVDNASDVDSVKYLLAWAVRREVSHDVRRVGKDLAVGTDPIEAHVTFLLVSQNRGFAGGNNLGLRLLCSDQDISHFLLLNNDTTVEPDLFAEFTSAIHAAPSAALIGSTIFEARNPSKVWYAGGRFHLRRALVVHDRQVPKGSTPVETEFVTGCAMLISREAVVQVGQLPECYFPLYMEDAEYSYRVRRLGLTVVYAPRAIVYHKVGSTVGLPSVSPAVAYCANRHRAFFVRRNLRSWLKLTALAYLAITKPARALVEALSGRPRIGWAVLRGTVAGILSRRAHEGGLDEQKGGFPFSPSQHPVPREPNHHYRDDACEEQTLHRVVEDHDHGP